MANDKDWTPKPCTPEIIEQARKLCQYLGATNEQMWEFFGVSKRHFYNWLEEEPELREAVTLGKIGADMNVAASMYHRACGYDKEDVDIKMFNGDIIETPYMKHYPADVTAGIFWLCNRNRENWNRNPTYKSSAALDEKLKEVTLELKKLELKAAESGGSGDKLADSLAELIKKLPG